MYLYGYLNGIRSGRDLEKECLRNIEMQWLLEDIRPNCHSITDFRKNNPAGLKNTFKLFVSLFKDADLISGETISIDGFLAVAKNNFLLKLILWVRKLVFKNEGKYETKPQILLEKKTLNPLEILSQTLR